MTNGEAPAAMDQQKVEATEMRIQFHDEETRGARIKVIGVGGGGNAVNRMIQAGLEAWSLLRRTPMCRRSSSRWPR